MNAEEFRLALRKHIESLGEIISYLQKENKEGFLISKLRGIQGFLAYIEKSMKEACSDGGDKEKYKGDENTQYDD